MTRRSLSGPDSPYISPLPEKAVPSWPFNYSIFTSKATATSTSTSNPASAPERARVPIPPARNIHFPDEVYNYKSIEEAEFAIMKAYNAKNSFPSDASKSRIRSFPGESYLFKTEHVENVAKVSSSNQHNRLKQETKSEPSGSTNSESSSNDSSNDSSKVKDDIVVNVTVRQIKK